MQTMTLADLIELMRKAHKDGRLKYDGSYVLDGMPLKSERLIGAAHYVMR